jgi:pimeloyl-ACP methyl ester carboxylesterase
VPAVFVHGVPDTAIVWNALRQELSRRDAIALSLPGFGVPVPTGFDATKEAYVTWLLGELERIEGPIDLVAHDWGALLALRAVSVRPASVRSWAAGAAPIDAAYVWHAMARLWQTPETGEQIMEEMRGEALVSALVAAEVPAPAAAAAAQHINAAMKQCILRLYRSAVDVGSEWEGDLAGVTAPGLVIWGARDPYAAPEFGQRLASHTGADFALLEACGHWWQLQRPREVAARLESFWSGVERGA